MRIGTPPACARARAGLELVFQTWIDGAHCVAAAEVIAAGEVCEGLIIQRALELVPQLKREVYLDLLSAARTAPNLGKVLAAQDGYLEKHAEARLLPVLRFLRKEKRLLPLS